MGNATNQVADRFVESPNKDFRTSDFVEAVLL